MEFLCIYFNCRFDGSSWNMRIHLLSPEIFNFILKWIERCWNTFKKSFSHIFQNVSSAWNIGCYLNSNRLLQGNHDIGQHSLYFHRKQMPIKLAKCIIYFNVSIVNSFAHFTIDENKWKWPKHFTNWLHKHRWSIYTLRLKEYSKWVFLLWETLYNKYTQPFPLESLEVCCILLTNSKRNDT